MVSLSVESLTWHLAAPREETPPVYSSDAQESATKPERTSCTWPVGSEGRENWNSPGQHRENEEFHSDDDNKQLTHNTHRKHTNIVRTFFSSWNRSCCSLDRCTFIKFCNENVHVHLTHEISVGLFFYCRPQTHGQPPYCLHAQAQRLRRGGEVTGHPRTSGDNLDLGQWWLESQGRSTCTWRLKVVLNACTDNIDLEQWWTESQGRSREDLPVTERCPKYNSDTFLVILNTCAVDKRVDQEKGRVTKLRCLHGLQNYSALCHLVCTCSEISDYIHIIIYMYYVCRFPCSTSTLSSCCLYHVVQYGIYMYMQPIEIECFNSHHVHATQHPRATWVGIAKVSTDQKRL